MKTHLVPVDGNEESIVTDEVRDWTHFYDDDGEPFLAVPRVNLSDSDAAMIISVYRKGIAAGKRSGKLTVQYELRQLLGIKE